MTDLSLLDASGQAAAPTSAFDASQVDNNLKAIRAVQSSWRLPQIPDEVTLDLASQPGVTQDHLTNLLYGIESDFHGDQAETIPLYQAPVLPEFNTLDKTRRIVTDVASLKPATTVDNTAIQRWKMAAIDGGYLDAPAGGVIDNAWSPEFESIRKSMAYDEHNADERGNRIGAMSMKNLTDQLYKWTSPTGLLAAATNLDLMWDFGAIGREKTTWGDKWRAVGKSKNPLDFAGNLIDALTGPIDDIAMPILNWALLASGVGEAYDFARIAYSGGRAVAGAEAVEGLYKTSAFTKFVTAGYDATADVSRMREASGLAIRLGRSEKGGVKLASDLMTGWRNLRPVATSKKFLQTGMKLGLASQAEDLLPGYRGGGSVASATGFDALTWVQKNPLLMVGSGVAELFFTPYSTFRPGTFSGGGKSAISFVGRHLGGTEGKLVVGGVLGAGAGAFVGDDAGDVLKGAAFGAVGLAAVPGVGKGMAWAAAKADDVPILSKIMPKAVGLVGDFLQKTSWKAMAGNQNITNSFHLGMLGSLSGDALATYQDTFNQKGFLEAFAQHLGTDQESAGASMGFTSMSAAIDHIAASQGKKGTELFDLTRNKLIAQTRSFDLENIGAHTLDEVAWAASIGVGHRENEFRTLRAAFELDPASALEHASAHNRMAQETIRQLLSVEALPDGDLNVAASLYGWGEVGGAERASIIQNYLPQVMDTFGNWPAFTSRTSEIRGLLHDGLLDDAVGDSYLLPSGKVVPTVAIKAPRVKVHPSTNEIISQHINDLIFRTPGTNVAKTTSGGSLDLLSKAIDPSIGRFTVMRLENADKGQVSSILAELKELKGLLKSATPQRVTALGEAHAANGELTALTRNQFAEVIKSMGAVKGHSAQTEMNRLYHFAKREGVSLADVKTYLDEAIQGAVDDPRLTDWLGMSHVVTGKPIKGETVGAVLQGEKALSARIVELQQRVDHTAVAIDKDRLLAGLGEGTPEYLRVQNHLDSLERDGYKLVHGKEFMMPEDLAHHTPIFDDVTRRHQNAATLGNFFKGRLPEVARATEQRRHLGIVFDEVGKLNLSTPFNDSDAHNLLEDVTAMWRSKQALAEQVRTDNEMGSWTQRHLGYAKAGIKHTPATLADFGRSDWAAITRKLEPVYGAEIANAVPKMLRRMRNTDFKDVGLYAIESHLRTQNQLASALKVLSGTEHGEGFIAHGKTARWAGAAIGGVYGAETSDNNATGFLKGAAIGAVAGTVAQGSLSPLFAKAEKAFNTSKWFQYGYLADDLAGMRDTMRFTLSPFFDLSRMAKSQELGQTAAPLRNAAGERIVMPLNSSPKALKNRWVKEGLTPKAAEEKFRGVTARFQAAARGDLGAAVETDFDVADDLAQYFQSTGILGHNPKQWEVTAFQHLTEQGFEPKAAYEAAHKMYTYGTGPRSAAELSVNFIFFPFSFQKKVYTYAAKYLSDDLSRSIMLHDAYKGYEILNEKYDLQKMWKEHLPLAEKLLQLNVFAHGASLGRLGGLNRPFIEPMMNMAANLHGKSEFVPGIFNLFNPHGVSVGSAADSVEIKKLVRSLTPVYNDINYLLGDGSEQIHALTSASKQTYAADANDGWTAWNTYKTEFRAALDKQGLKMTDLNKPWMAGTKMAYHAKRAEIEAQYPGWGDSRKKAVEKNAGLDQELADRFDRVYNGNASESDLLAFQFDQAVKAVTADQKLHGVDDVADWDPAARQQLINMATAMARGSLEWRNIYGKFFQRQLGPIVAEVRL